VLKHSSLDMVVINLSSLCYFHAVMMALYQTSVRLQTPYAKQKQVLEKLLA